MNAPAIATAAGAASAADRPPAAERLLCLDVFRGFTLLGMVLVNSHPGKIYPPLAHARWHGWTFTDLIFPFFMFIVGVAIPYSFATRLRRGESPRSLFVHILRRSVLLFAIGMFLNAVPDFNLRTLRIMGVLQRIAICYFMASVIYAYLRWDAKTIVRVSAVILVLYFVIMVFVPVPGYGAGVLEPESNWGAYIDRILMPGHLQRPMFEGKSLLGSFPALVTMLMGLLTGLWLRTSKPDYEKLTGMYFYGSLAMGAGAFWSLWFPVNQHLWTSSLVLLMGGIALLFLATFYYAVDVRKSTWWTTPFLVFGVNSLAVWVFSQLLMKVLVAASLWKAAGDGLSYYLGPMNGSLAFAILYDLFWLGVMYVLYRRRIYIKL
jgi:predicted acyltransferase